MKSALKPSLLAVLRKCAHGDPYAGCNGRSEFGGRSNQVAALYRRGLIDSQCKPTIDGNAVLREALPEPATTVKGEVAG